MFLILSLFMGFMAYGAYTKSDWGQLAIYGILCIVFLIGWSSWRTEVTAHVNRTRWWAHGTEPSWADRKRRERERELEKERERKRRLEAPQNWNRADRSPAEDWRKYERNVVRISHYPEENVRRADGAELLHQVCHKCGRRVAARCIRVATDDGLMWEYDCPVCGCRNLTKLGVRG